MAVAEGRREGDLTANGMGDIHLGVVHADFSPPSMAMAPVVAAIRLAKRLDL